MGEENREHSEPGQEHSLREANRLSLSESMEEILEKIEALGAEDNLAAVMIHCNDTYFIDARQPQIPGMSRVATLVRTIRSAVTRCTGEDRTLFLHSGDYLSPSAMSAAFDGRPMVELLKECGLNYATLGNHEFDFYGKPYLKPGVLKERLLELSPCVHLLANLESTEHEMIQKIAYWPEKDPFLAIAGLAGRQTIRKALGAGFTLTGSWQDIASNIVEEVRDRPGLGGLVMLSHMDRDEDKELQRIISDRPAFRSFQYVLGGHDHGIFWGERDRYHCYLFKCESNFKTISVFLLPKDGIAAASLHENYTRLQKPTKEQGHRQPRSKLSKETLAGEILRDYRSVASSELRHDLRVAFEKVIAELFHTKGERTANEDFALGILSSQVISEAQTHAFIPAFYRSSHILSSRQHLFGIEEDAHASELIIKWQMAMEEKYGRDNQIVDFSPVAPPEGMDASDKSLRSRSTDFGNFVADAIRKATSADLVLLNAGAFRIDGHVSSRVTRHVLKDVFVYDYAGALSVLEMSAEEVSSFYEHALKKRDHGAFLQVSEPLDTAKRRMGRLKVVLITHMLANDEDGYQHLLSAQRGIPAIRGTPNKLLKQFGARALKKPIVALVESGGPATPYSSEIRLLAALGHTELETWSLDFVELVRRYRQACERANLSEHVGLDVLVGHYQDIPDPQVAAAIQQGRKALCSFIKRHKREAGERFLKQFFNHFAHDADKSVGDGVPYQRYVEKADEAV